ncbi:phosphonate C-P lyase system protein PhnL [Allohahella marinimesophila]|uniref:Phosphonate C-P lyase system protein PhnL n=1 Tax=Allohahella marinimesophila TaxID=1054972 RepID=A0ABP7PPV4_9GAMM
MPLRIQVDKLNKTFTLHNQGAVVIDVLHDINFEVHAGECVVLDGHSGAGKSTLLRTLYGNYKANSGSIRISANDSTIDLVTASPRAVLALRRQVIGYVSQFLRVIPRVTALDVVMEPARLLGMPVETVRPRAEDLLRQLNIPERLWQLAPSTFSGGEQQRINIARGFMVDYPVLLLDEPTASLDADNCAVVMSLIEAARERGAAIVGIFHDSAIRERLADRLIPMQQDVAATQQSQNERPLQSMERLA